MSVILNLWDGMPVLLQELLIISSLLLPIIITGLILLRGFAPWPLVRALLWRFSRANLMFVLLIAISVGMGIGLLAQERGLRHGSARAADKFGLVVAAPGSDITVMMATVFLQPSKVPLLGPDVFAALSAEKGVQSVTPLAFGDSLASSPVMGSTAEFVKYLSDGKIEGRIWQNSHEAIVGASVALQIGQHFTPAHGAPKKGAMNAEHAEHDGHEEHAGHENREITVVGRMAFTGTPWDRAIVVPIETIWETHGKPNGHAPQNQDRIGPPFDLDYFLGSPSLIVQADNLGTYYTLRGKYTTKGSMAFFPAEVLAKFYSVMGDIRQAMSLMSLVTQILVAASVLLSLFILTRLFRRQMALLRALGAPSRFIVAVIWSYASTLLVAGALGGILVGLATTFVLSKFITAQTGILVNAPLGWSELHLVAGFISAMGLLALIPAAGVIRQSLVAGLQAR